MSEASRTFSPRLMAAVIAAGVFALLGFAVLTSYAPDLRGARDGGAHALSRAGVGFAGLVQLVGDADRRAVLLRDEAGWDTEDLVIATPTGATDGKRLRDLLALRVVKPTLLVLPKWSTRAMEMRPGWVEHGGPMAPAIIAAQFRGVPPLPTLRVEQASAGRRPPLRGRDMPAGWRVPTPDRVQTVHGPGLVPLLETADGGIVLARVGDAPLFLLADPDLLANHAIDDPAVARAALAMLAELNSTGAEAVVFDLITAGLVESRGLLKLAFEPPFVALTIALLGAVLLASVQAAVRFGPAAAEPRAIPYGSRTLVDNIASLLRLTKRDHEVGGRYAVLVAERVAATVAAPPQLRGRALEEYLDGIAPPGAPRFSELAGAARAAATRDELLPAARRLHEWSEGLMRDRR